MPDAALFQWKPHIAPPPPPNLACVATFNSPVFSATILWFLAGLGTVLLVLVLLVRRKWKGWYRRTVDEAFAYIDSDNSGRIRQDELWAGVLRVYLQLRQMNIPVDPPSRETIFALVTADPDGELDLEEFEVIMYALSSQVLVRTITMVVFAAAWPLLMGILYNQSPALCPDPDSPDLDAATFDPILSCMCSTIDDLHLVPVLLVVLGFVLVAPPLVHLTDWLTAATLSRAPSVTRIDPTPLLHSNSGRLRGSMSTQQYVQAMRKSREDEARATAS